MFLASVIPESNTWFRLKEMQIKCLKKLFFPHMCPCAEIEKTTCALGMNLASEGSNQQSSHCVDLVVCDLRPSNFLREFFVFGCEGPSVVFRSSCEQTAKCMHDHRVGCKSMVLQIAVCTA